MKIRFGAISRTVALAATLAAGTAAPALAQANGEAPAASGAVTATGKDATRAPTAVGAVAAPASAPATAFFSSQDGSQWMASKLIGATVVGADDKAVGAITDLMLGQNGATEGAVIGVGGFLGVGEKKVAVPFGKLEVMRGDDGKVDKVRVALSRDELEKAPTFVTLAEQKARAKASGPARPPK
ncbi:PRC-barrel domain-containing protein [Camelimonas lactis]|uniref:PRC-barrel domain protein n=1 Tax=Camelimonas lactis TaxID=659006 RepID=A0A4R2GYE3_9HYPH|nr:PRC-barrel domain-containing protein [Camelimonas lactis]TCO16312.1 PRC-barrel domain protein [Camelimonas lactis]